MEQSLIAILEGWVIRNPLLLALLLGPIALAVAGVIGSAWRSGRRSAAAAPDREFAAPAASAAPAAPAIAPPKAAPKRDRLGLTREGLVGRIGQVLGGRTVDADLLDQLEALLFEADLGVQTVDSLLAKVRSEASGGDADAVKGVLRDAILEKLRRIESSAGLAATGSPHVILVLG
ncbi:MAG: signal recognition particle receptor subunit alpha, partial [Myxococcota bacterium]